MTLNDKYKNLITAPPTVRYTIVTGGRGSGKSYAVSTFLTGLSFEKNQNILYTRQTLTSAYISIIPEYLSKIEELNLQQHFSVTQTDIANNLSGNRILFRGIQAGSKDNTANLKSLQGISCFVCEEAEEMNEDAFDKIDLSIRQQGVHNRVILILNPASKAHWVYQRFFESRGVEPGFNGIVGDTCYIHTSYLDNIDNLSESFIKNIELMKEQRPAKYKHIIEGNWLDKAEGVIFNNWTIGKFNETIPPIFGQDFGFSTDPTTLVETAIDKKLKKIYIREHYGKQGMTTTDVYQFNTLAAGKHLIIGDSAEPRLIHEVKQRGCNIVPTKKGAGSVLAGINQMLDYELIIDPKSITTIKELNNYIWSDKKSGTPVDANNHMIDAIRYAVSYQLDNPNKGKYSVF